MKRLIATGGLVLSMAAVVLAFAVPAMAGSGAVITNTATHSIPGEAGYNFSFWNGNGDFVSFAPTYYQEVLTPSGVNNEVLKGQVANDTGAEVVYSAFSGGPIPSGQSCWDFQTGQTSTDWQMTIEASGAYTLACHFSK
jgi:hypothetical protein